jgi:DNA-binding response OmpR family regulator
VARNGEEAVRIYADEKDRIDLVILDMVMPGLNGSQTFDRIREIDAHARVVMASGYCGDSRAEDLLARGAEGFIQKPFGLKELSSRLAAVLRAAPAAG